MARSRRVEVEGCVVDVRGMYLDRYSCPDLDTGLAEFLDRQSKNKHVCLTHSNFFHAPFLLLLPLRAVLSLCLPLLRLRILPSPPPLVMRRSFCSLLTAADCLRGGEPAYMASSGASSERSVAVARCREGAGRVFARFRGGKLVLSVDAADRGAW
jgi:hypothetical protein